ncbi:hypothetical protein SO802_031802 [Lithocarpus litseifolius]|uniref:Uncharacterized protein n=1 Tax=Lithocarpus litseifolius TaxID=425828 RepID=A0AAW2BLA0_9ROSI
MNNQNRCIVAFFLPLERRRETTSESVPEFGQNRRLGLVRKWVPGLRLKLSPPGKIGGVAPEAFAAWKRSEFGQNRSIVASFFHWSGGERNHVRIAAWVWSENRCLGRASAFAAWKNRCWVAPEAFATWKRSELARIVVHLYEVVVRSRLSLGIGASDENTLE